MKRIACMCIIALPSILCSASISPAGELDEHLQCLNPLLGNTLIGGYTYYIVVCGYQDEAGYYTFDVIEHQSSIDDDDEIFPNEMTLYQNYPNPFNASTTICYSWPEPSEVTIEIFDILGRLIEVVSEGGQTAGEHQIIWNPENHLSGVYLYRLQTGKQSRSDKMMLLR